MKSVFTNARRWLNRMVLLCLLLPGLGQLAGPVAPAPLSSQSPAAPAAALQPERAITYGYDAAGRLGSASYDGGAVIFYSYDAAGNLLGSADRLSAYLPLIVRAAQ